MASCSSTICGPGPLSSCLALAPLSEVSWAYLRGSLLGSRMCSTVWCVFSTISARLSGLLELCSKPWNPVESPPTLVLCNIVLAILVPLPFCINFRVITSVSTKIWNHVRPACGGMHVYHMLLWPQKTPPPTEFSHWQGPGRVCTFASLIANTGISFRFAVSKLNISPNFAASLLSELPFSYPWLVF